MHLTRNEIKDKIFELEIELKELEILVGQAYPDPEDYEVPEYLEQQMQESVCYIQYYKQLLQELEQGE